MSKKIFLPLIISTSLLFPCVSQEVVVEKTAKHCGITLKKVSVREITHLEDYLNALPDVLASWGEQKILKESIIKELIYELEAMLLFGSQNVDQKLVNKFALQTVNIKIQNLIIEQEAKAANIVPDENAVAAEVKKSLSQQATIRRLRVTGRTEEDFANDIRFNHCMSLWYKKEIIDKIIVTEEELAAFGKDNDTTLSPERIKDIIKRRKSHQVFQDKLTELKNKYQVKIFISE